MGELAELIGIRIKSLREAQGWTQEQLSTKSGVHRTYIASLEMGQKNVTIESLTKLTKTLNITLSEFFSFMSNELTTPETTTLLSKIAIMTPKEHKDTLKLLSLIQTWGKD